MSDGRKKKPLVPRLRFPEFRDAGEWNSKRIGEFLSLEYGAPLPEEQRRDGKIPVVGSNGVVGYHCEPLIDGPAIVIGRKGSAGEVNWIDSACYPIDTTFFVRLSCKDCQLRFIHLLLERHRLPGLVREGGVPGLNRDDVYAVKTAIPKPSEQQKIADCLSSLDELIELEAWQCEALRQHKKGLMQQLFPAEGETTPRLRFPEFRDAGEWEVKRLGQVAKYENGKAHEQDIDENGEYIVVNSKFISTEGEVKKFSHVANLLAKKGEILMVLSDVPNGRAIAKCFYVDADNTYTVNQRICKLTAKKAASALLFYILDRNKYFLAFDDGVKQTNLKKDDVLNCPVILPKDEKEQQKIADCLSSLDELIALQSQKVEALRQHKKGLMQQLFPQEVA